MGTTLHIAKNVSLAAKESLQHKPQRPAATRNGLPILALTCNAITSELINSLSDAEDCFHTSLGSRPQTISDFVNPQCPILFTAQP